MPHAFGHRNEVENCAVVPHRQHRWVPHRRGQYHPAPPGPQSPPRTARKEPRAGDQQLVASTAMASISEGSTNRMKQQDPHWLGCVDGSWDASGSGSLEAHREVKE